MTYHSTDGSFLKLVYQRTGEWTLFFPDGSRVENDANGQRIIDRNSNFVEKERSRFPTERPPPAGSTSSGATPSNEPTLRSTRTISTARASAAKS
ncbi:MAG: hypothetical protein IPJ30_02490 [Acidobacteria bacterium]|nr:hypothetical protein [Acidobacteriota bacterium]